MQQSMLDMILDRILTRPVDWLSAQNQIFSDPAIVKDDGSLDREVLNFGPGYGVVQSEAQRRPNVRVLDLSGKGHDAQGSIPSSKNADGDIAIIGMAVDLPGAPDSESLWKVLMDEINTVEQVCDPIICPFHQLSNLILADTRIAIPRRRLPRLSQSQGRKSEKIARD